MRLARARHDGFVVPMASDDETAWYDLRPIVTDVDPTSVSPSALLQVRGAIAAGDLQVITPDEFVAPLARVGKIVCVGLNYREHARETGMAEPGEPVLFMKAGDTVSGPFDDVLIPPGSVKTDWEIELGVVIGEQCSYLDSPEAAADRIFGYVISNDVSEREYQLERGGQWDKGKNCPGFNPMGPWIRTADEVPDPQALDLRLNVNGTTRQSSTTADMIFRVDYLVWYISHFMTLFPGDVINTGTPHGVAMGLPGNPYLRSGDRVELTISGLGTQAQNFR